LLSRSAGEARWNGMLPAGPSRSKGKARGASPHPWGLRHRASPGIGGNPNRALPGFIAHWFEHDSGKWTREKVPTARFGLRKRPPFSGASHYPCSDSDIISGGACHAVSWRTSPLKVSRNFIPDFAFGTVFRRVVFGLFPAKAFSPWNGEGHCPPRSTGGAGWSLTPPLGPPTPGSTRDRRQPKSCSARC
jgi:hypothetical protein